jgi:hypothetical protein
MVLPLLTKQEPLIESEHTKEQVLITAVIGDINVELKAVVLTDALQKKPNLSFLL